VELLHYRLELLEPIGDLSAPVIKEVGHGYSSLSSLVMCGYKHEHTRHGLGNPALSQSGPFGPLLGKLEARQRPDDLAQRIHYDHVLGVEPFDHVEQPFLYLHGLGEVQQRGQAIVRACRTVWGEANAAVVLTAHPSSDVFERVRLSNPGEDV